MGTLEQEIKDFVMGLGMGVTAVGTAGPERLNGPPSMDPTYTMKKAQSVVAFVLPMDIGAIYDFLGKKSPAPHNIDQMKGNQRINHIGSKAAKFIQEKGHKAAFVPSNCSYRRSLNPIFIDPSFSHRYAAIVSGLGAMGLSGNVMTEDHGASVYLGSVVTDARLESDPMLDPRHFMDRECKTCRMCARACASQMFLEDEEEQILINGELHPRGKRRNVHLCMTTCFGMHSLSYDKKWTTWGKHWITDWIGNEMDPTNRSKIRKDFGKATMVAGDSGKRYEIIRASSCEIFSEDMQTSIPEYKDLPEDELERDKLLSDLAAKYMGVTGLKSPNVLTCGQCSLVCGPTFDERADRLHMLQEGGLVVPGEEGRMVHCDTYEQACEIKKKYPQRVSKAQMAADQKHLASIYTRRYFGIEPKSLWQGFTYQRKLKKATKEKGLIPG